MVNQWPDIGDKRQGRAGTPVTAKRWTKVRVGASHTNPLPDVGLSRIAVTLDVKGAVDLTARTALTDSIIRGWRKIDAS